MSSLNRRDFLKVSAAAGLGGLSMACTSKAATKLKDGRKPNILFLFSDQHNGRMMGCAGHPDVLTPNLDHLAGQGVMFSRAYCQDGICVPSRASMMTGQYPRTTGVLDNPNKPPKPETLITLARHLQAQGYTTAAYGKRHLPPSLDDGWNETCTTLPPKGEPSDKYYWDWIEEKGLLEALEHDWNAEMGFQLEGNQAAPMAARVSSLPPECTMEAYTAQKTIELIRGAKDSGKPFFCWSSFYRPHQPYTPQQKYVDLYDLDKIELPGSLHEPAEKLPPMLAKWRANPNKPWCLALAAEDINLYRRYIGYYYALVSEIDDHIGSILAALDEEGLADNTIVLYTSDHGDFVGAHGMIEKCAWGHNIYEDTLRVPLMMRWPGVIREGDRREDLVELVDLFPTLLDLAGVEAPTNYDLPGRTLTATLIDGKAVGREVAFSENWSQLSAITRDDKLGAWIKPQDGDYPDMYFDTASDPLELKNTHGSDSVAGREAELLQALKGYVARTPNATDKALIPLALAGGSTPAGA